MERRRKGTQRLALPEMTEEALKDHLRIGLLEFYSDAIGEELFLADQGPKDGVTQDNFEHQVFCDRMITNIHEETLLELTRSGDAGEVFEGHLGLQEYAEWDKYECWN